MKKTALPYSFLSSTQKGYSIPEITLGVVFVFVLVALVLYVVDMDNFMHVVYDIKLNSKMTAVANEIKNFNINGEYPTCSEVLGNAPYCTGIVFGGVKSCDCPFFELKGVDTGIFPYPGFKYLKTREGFCMSSVANNPKKGKYFKINYPKDADVVRANEGC